MNSVQPSKVRAVPTLDDIACACAWRIEGGPYREEMALIALWLQWCNEPEEFREDDPTIVPVLQAIRRPGDRRSTWGLFVALLALVYFKRRDWLRFVQVGGEALNMYAQAHRASTKRRGNDLNDLIKALVTECPDMPTQRIAAELREHAGNRTYEALVDYDHDTQILTYQPNVENGTLQDIGPAALRRRIERIRATATG